MARGIEERIKAWIAGKERLGDQAAGSHHTGYNTLEIVSIGEPQDEQGRQVVHFTYRIHTLTEFEDDHLPPPPLKEGALDLGGD